MSDATLRADQLVIQRASTGTRLFFLANGFAIACWAPLVPFAKVRLAIGDGELGLLLACIGLGSIAAMAVTGLYSARNGPHRVMLVSGFGLIVLLPPLAFATSSLSLGVALLLFGAALGSLDVAMNMHGVDVERQARQPLMSGFHAQFSIGGVFGAAMMTLLLWMGVGPVVCTLIDSALIAVLLALAASRILRQAEASPSQIFALPHGFVLVLALLAAAMFLVEGAVLDWSAVLLVGQHLVPAVRGGIGFAVFSVAMTLGRLGGDRLVAALGDRTAMVGGATLAMIGFIMVLLAPALGMALAGFAMVGLGAANIVPILFRLGGTQRFMPAGIAIAAISTTGYAGGLAGPAAMGLVAHWFTLAQAFWLLAGLMALVALAGRRVTTKP